MHTLVSRDAEQMYKFIINCYQISHTHNERALSKIHENSGHHVIVANNSNKMFSCFISTVQFTGTLCSLSNALSPAYAIKFHHAISYCVEILK